MAVNVNDDLEELWKRLDDRYGGIKAFCAISKKQKVLLNLWTLKREHTIVTLKSERTYSYNSGKEKKRKLQCLFECRMTKKIATTVTFPTTETIKDLIKSNDSFHCILKSRRNLFAFTLVMKNKVVLAKQLPKINTTEIPAINSSRDFP